MDSRLWDAVLARLEAVASALERGNFLEYMDYATSPRKVYRRAFFLGLMRGMGFAIGMTVLGALVLLILQRIVQANLPVIGDLLEEIMRVVEERF